MDSNNSYTPKVNDYVIWTDSLGRVTEGWVYFADSSYITIEIAVKDKPDVLVKFHKKTHCCVLCFPHQWHELKHIKTRAHQHDNAPIDISAYKSQEHRYSDPQ